MQCGLKAPARAPVQRLRWIWGRGPGCRRRSRQSGFSLLETMIAAAILSILLMALMVVLVQGQSTFDTLATRSSAQLRIQIALDKMVREMRLGSLGNLSSGSPPQFLIEGQVYDNVTFIPAVGVVGSDVQWGNPITYRFQYDANEETTPGADDDGDGLTDEGVLIRGQGGSDTVICGRVTGLSFTRSNDQLTIELTASARDHTGHVHNYTGKSSVSFRN